MALINKTYFIGNIYLPEAKPSLKDNPADESFDNKIDTAEYDCLVEVLGPTLADELYSNIDLNEANLLKSDADSKWSDLLYGLSYTSINNEDKVWKGLLYKSTPLAENVNTSLLSFYAYVYHERIHNTTRANIGHTIEASKNSKVISPRQKVSYAWNKFVDLVQGENYSNKALLIENSLLGGYGVDFYSNKSKNICLNEFIIDINNLQEEDIYENFKPNSFERMNEIM